MPLTPYCESSDVIARAPALSDSSFATAILTAISESATVIDSILAQKYNVPFQPIYGLTNDQFPALVKVICANAAVAHVYLYSYSGGGEEDPVAISMVFENRAYKFIEDILEGRKELVEVIPTKRPGLYISKERTYLQNLNRLDRFWQSPMHAPAPGYDLFQLPSTYANDINGSDVTTFGGIGG